MFVFASKVVASILKCHFGLLVYGFLLPDFKLAESSESTISGRWVTQ